MTLYLSTILDPVVLEGVIFLYRLGVTKDRDTIFFQIDAQGRCRTGKIMKYNPSTGHRIKDENVPSKITWVHSLLKARGSLPPGHSLNASSENICFRNTRSAKSHLSNPKRQPSSAPP